MAKEMMDSFKKYLLKLPPWLGTHGQPGVDDIEVQSLDPSPDIFENDRMFQSVLNDRSCDEFIGDPFARHLPTDFGNDNTRGSIVGIFTTVIIFLPAVRVPIFTVTKTC